MRSETKFGTKPVKSVGVVPKKRGRPAKVRPSTIQTMKESGDPDIEHVRDLYVVDRTEILEGADTENFRYRWCEESKMGLRKSQGYTEVDDPNVRTHHDGTYWQAEGRDRKQQNKGGLKLMKIPLTLAKKRDAIKAEKVARNSNSAENALTSDMRRYGGEVMGDAATSEVMGGE